MTPAHLASVTQAAPWNGKSLRLWRLFAANSIVAAIVITTEASAQVPPPAPTARVAQAAGPGDNQEPRLPPPTPVTSPHAEPSVATCPPKTIPITLDTILRLAETHNAKIGLARARVADAAAETDLTAKNWLPNVYVGTTYYRHEGGISNEDGTITRSSWSALFGGVEVKTKIDLRELTYQRITAERAYWQRKGELSQLTSETLVDATTTYIDLLAARTHELILVGLQGDLQDLLARAERLASVEPGARVVAARTRTFQAGIRQNVAHAREDFARAAAKLTYLLGLDPCTILVPLDLQLIPLELVDAHAPLCDLISQVLANGPGIQETERILALAQEAIDKANGPGRLLPVFEAYMAEGGYGTGPGDQMAWDNRFDLGMRVRWNLTDLFKRSERQRILHAKAAQAQFANDDLRGKLSAGVQEARDSIVLGHEQIVLGQDYLDQAREVNKITKDRMLRSQDAATIATSQNDVLLSLESIALAQITYLNAVRDYDKAELRLLVLLGVPLPPHAASDSNCPVPASKQQ